MANLGPSLSRMWAFVKSRWSTWPPGGIRKRIKLSMSNVDELPGTSSVKGFHQRRPRLFSLIGGVIVITIMGIFSASIAPVSIRIKYPSEAPYDPRKLALLIENRPQPFIVPLLLHFTTVIPPEWRIQVMGSPEVVELVNSSPAARYHVASGKLNITLIPSEVTLTDGESISQFLTTRSLYESLLPAEWLLIWQTDSILCANSEHSLNDWLDYDYVGAPWQKEDRFGGNGGLSMRRVSAMLDVLDYQVRAPHDDPEDVWWSYRLGQRVGARVANGTVEAQFSIETVFGGEPMGFHIGHSAEAFNRPWVRYENRQSIMEYCPEVKMIIDMEIQEFQNCAGLNPPWEKSERDSVVTRLIPW